MERQNNIDGASVQRIVPQPSPPKPYYEKDGITIYHGDFFELGDQWNKPIADVVITDPPYMFGAASVSGTANSKVSRFGDLLNQSFFFREIIQKSKRLISNNGCLWMFSSWRSLPVMMKAAVESNHGIESVLVWDKCWIGPGGPIGLRPSYEICVFIPIGEFALPNRGLPDIWRHKWSSKKPHGHPSEKPLSLMTKLVEETPGVVLDPFMGSGTTLHAAMECGRKAIGFEIEEKYCETAAKRLEQGVLF